MITVALTKGRLFKDFVHFLDENNLRSFSEPLNNEDRSLYTTIGNVKFIYAKGPDVPVYVEKGIADLGIAGQDILSENQFEVLNVSKLPFGICHMAIAGPPEVEKINSVATSFSNIAFDYFRKNRQEVSMVPLHGSVELAPLLGLTDAIVDIVQTGNTLRENGLIEYENIMDIQARLIANKQTFYTKEKEIYEFIRLIGVF